MNPSANARATGKASRENPRTSEGCRKRRSFVTRRLRADEYRGHTWSRIRNRPAVALTGRLRSRDSGLGERYAMSALEEVSTQRDRSSLPTLRSVVGIRIARKWYGRLQPDGRRRDAASQIHPPTRSAGGSSRRKAV